MIYCESGLVAAERALPRWMLPRNRKYATLTGNNVGGINLAALLSAARKYPEKSKSLLTHRSIVEGFARKVASVRCR